MIDLNLAIGSCDIASMKFKTVADLIDYIEELKRFDAIWLVVDDLGDESRCEILITEDVSKIISAIIADFFSCTSLKESKLFIQEYQSFEDAYSVALDMREGHPRCYN